MTYPIYSPELAPAASRPILEGAKKSLGFVPNLLGGMAGAPALLNAYTTIAGLFDETSLSPTERQVVLLAVSAENECDYCVAAHTAIAAMQKVSAAVVEAIRAGEPIADARLEALRRYAVAVTATRGNPSEDVSRAFFDAGYGETQALEVILGVGMKTLSNYTNHIAGTVLDKQFQPVAWTKAA